VWGPAPFSVRRLGVLLRGLPRDSALWRDLDLAARHGWGHNEELLATLLELVDLGNRQFVSANSKRGQVQPDPIIIRRPTTPPKRRATPEETEAFFANLGIPVIKKRK